MTIHIIVVISVIVLGILFMLIEIFLLPGISIAGIAGAIFLVGGIIYSYMFLGSTAGNITLAASAVTLGLTFFGLLKSKSLERISLNTNIDDKVDNSYLLKIAVDDTGVAISRLNPIGKVLINDIVAEGKSFDGEFIEEDTEIIVIKVDTYNVLVKRK
ncbi:MAG: NfeD family protein [Fermentimonas sp.]|nr:NfeD family protein [Fermentimonas sp.]